MRGESSSQKRARTGGGDQFARLALSAAEGGDQADPEAGFAFAEHGKRVAHGVNFLGKSEDGGVQVAQQAVAERGFAFNDVFDLARINIFLRDDLQ